MHLCFEKVITALLLRLLMAVQIASSFLSYTVGMEGKYLRLVQETSMAVAASTNQTSAPATVSSLFVCYIIYDRQSTGTGTNPL